MRHCLIMALLGETSWNESRIQLAGLKPFGTCQSAQTVSLLNRQWDWLFMMRTNDHVYLQTNRYIIGICFTWVSKTIRNYSANYRYYSRVVVVVLAGTQHDHMVLCHCDSVSTVCHKHDKVCYTLRVVHYVGWSHSVRQAVNGGTIESAPNKALH